MRLRFRGGRGRNSATARQKPPTEQMLHAVRAGEGSLIHHPKQREGQAHTSAPIQCVSVGLAWGEGVFLRTLFCLYDAACSQESLLLKFPAFLDL